MNFQYSNTKMWRKKAWGSLLNMVTGLFVIGFSLYINGRVQEFVVYTTAALFLGGLWQMIHYLKMPDRDYIRFEEGEIDIRRGFADPRLRVPDEEVKRVQQINDVITIRTEKGEEESIYLENLSEEDGDELLSLLRERYGERMNVDKEA
jgi:hypothetical protein